MRTEFFGDAEYLSAHPEIVKSSFFDFYKKRGFTIEENRPLTENTEFWRIFIVNSALVRFAPVFEWRENLGKPVCLCQECIKGVSDWVWRREGFLTFFEQLGTGSQTHSQKEAITIFWEFFGSSLAMDRSRFLVTVYDGDSESHQIWRELGFEDSQILPFGERNYFSFAGGKVKGPVSALVYDRGPEYHQRFFGPTRKEDCHLDCECGRYSELADIGFFTSTDGIFLIDTGIGLERLVAVLSGKDSVFQVGQLRNLGELILNNCGLTTVSGKDKEIAIRILADHSRSIIALFGEDICLSNKGVGYMFRKIFRRAILAGRRLGIKEPFLSKWLPGMIDLIKEENPFFGQINAGIVGRAKLEEESFFRTIQRGEKFFSKLCHDPLLSSEEALFLYDTYGLPPELIRELVAERGWQIDTQAFETMFK